MLYQTLSSLPMTRLEQMLKQCFLEQRNVGDPILTSEELSSYIERLASEYGNRPGYEIREESITGLINPNLLELGQRVIRNPKDNQALKALSSGYQQQNEERYIRSSHDISVAQMLRYMPAHWHSNEYFEVYYAFSGECPVHFSDETITVRPGTVLIVAPGVMHANPCYADDAVLVYYMIRSSTFDQVFWNQIPSDSLLKDFFFQALSDRQPNAYLQFETDNDPDLCTLMARLYGEFLEDEPYCAQMMNSLMSLCFTLLLRRYEGTARLPRTEQFYWKHEYSGILSYIQTHYATVKLPKLAETFHYSEKQISRIVKSCTGMKFIELITKLRMERAAALLQGGVSMDAIAAAVGYTTVSSFYRTFIGYYGCAPAKYAQIHFDLK